MRETRKHRSSNSSSRRRRRRRRRRRVGRRSKGILVITSVGIVVIMGGCRNLGRMNGSSRRNDSDKGRVCLF
jgi:hypothetical protein